MDILGHRGSRHPGPENTVAAVLGAQAAHADGVEIDVRRAGDGSLAVVHDPLVGGQPVRDLEVAALAAAGVPTLDAVLDAVAAVAPRGFRVVCEVKNLPGEPDFDAPAEGTAHALVAALQRRSGGPEVVVSSFNWFAIEVVRDAHAAPTAFLVAPGVALAAGLAYVTSAGHGELHVPVDALRADPAGVEAAHEAGVRVVGWTIETVDEARALRDLGVDGVICDDPAAVVAALR